jgi:hypothetical protein
MKRNQGQAGPTFQIEQFLRKVTTGIESIINSVYVANSYHV